MSSASHYQRSDLAHIACEVMRERGLEPEFPAAVQEQLRHLKGPRQEAKTAPLHDLTGLPWCSLDNDDSRDLDQLTACKPQHGGAVTIFVAVADVDALVEQGTPIDRHAWHNTTAVYTSARNFPLLPERLSTDLSSLNPHVERLAVVTEMLIAADGTLQSERIYRARVRNRAQLAYDAVSAWIEGEDPLPPAARAVPALEQQLRIQDEVAQRLRAASRRGLAGAGNPAAACSVRRRAAGGHPAAGAEPRTPADRGVHDRRQWLQRALPGPRRHGLAAPGGALPGTLAAPGGTGGTPRACAAGRTGLGRAGGLPGRATGPTRCASRTCRWWS